MKFIRNRLIEARLCATLAAAALLSVPAFAVTAVWDGGAADKNWSTAENWEGDAVPQPADDLSVHLPFSAARYGTVANLANPFTLNRLTISNYQYDVSGNTLHFAGATPRIVVGPGGHGFYFSCPLDLSDDLTLEMQQSYNFVINSTVSGPGSFTVTGGGGARLGHFYKEASYSGPTVVDGFLSLGSTGGRLASSTGVVITTAGYLLLASGASGAATNRIADAIPVMMAGGMLANANADETVNRVTMDGGLGYLNAAAGVLRFGNLVRARSGSARIRGGSTLGSGVGTNLFIGTVDGAATSTLLAGGGGAADTPTVSIVPFLAADDTFVTYTETHGLRRLSPATEYADGLAAAGTSDNVRQTNSVALAADTTVNALLIPSYNLTISGARTLKLNSGALLVSQNTRSQTISCSQLDCNGREAFITVHNIGGYSTALAISSVITNAAGLTFAGSFANDFRNTTSSPLTLTGASVYTGRTAVLVGTLTAQGGDNRLPVSTWLSLGSGAQLTLNGINQTVTGLEGLGHLSVATAGKTLTVSNATGFVLGGAITGAGNLRKLGSGTQTLSGACTYSGTTTVSNGTLRLDGSFAPAAGAVTVYPDGTLCGTGTVSRAVFVAGGTLAPGGAGGVLTVASNVTFAADSTLAVTVGAAGADRLACGAAVALDGALTVTVADGFQPRANQEWEIVTASGGLSGDFTSRNAPGFAVEKESDRVIVRYLAKGTAVLLR